MSHRLSRERAEKAARFRAQGHTWQETADECGYRSRQGAFDAVAALYKRFPPESSETARRSLTAGLRMQMARLNSRLDDAEVRDDTDAVVAISKELRTTADAIAKLNGLAVPVAQQVDVHVHNSPVAIVAEARERLLAVVDAEVVEIATAPGVPAMKELAR